LRLPHVKADTSPSLHAPCSQPGAVLQIALDIQHDQWHPIPVCEYRFLFGISKLAPHCINNVAVSTSWLRAAIILNMKVTTTSFHSKEASDTYNAVSPNSPRASILAPPLWSLSITSVCLFITATWVVVHEHVQRKQIQITLHEQGDVLFRSSDLDLLWTPGDIGQYPQSL
jgi:hypothetical protein